MKLKISFLAIFLFLIYSFQLKAQTEVTESQWIEKQEGDTMRVFHIYDKESNEDQVTYMLGGRKQVLSASQVKSYFKENRIQKIRVDPSGENKLASIVLTGTVSLARSRSIDEIDIFYILIDEKWLRLDPESRNLKPQLSELMPDFGKIITKKKVYYGLVSLGEAIAKYNEYRDPNYNRTGRFAYIDRARIGAFGSIGSSFLAVDEFESEQGRLINSSLGIGTKVRYNRYFSALIQLGYTQGNIKGEIIDIKLKTLDLTTLLYIPIADKSDPRHIYGAVGFNVKINVASSLESAVFETDDVIGLQGVALGTDLQLHCTLNRHFTMFGSYQYMPKIGTKFYKFFPETVRLHIKMNTVRLGVCYYY